MVSRITFTSAAAPISLRKLILDRAADTSRARSLTRIELRQQEKAPSTGAQGFLVGSDAGQELGSQQASAYKPSLATLLTPTQQGLGVLPRLCC